MRRTRIISANLCRRTSKTQYYNLRICDNGQPFPFCLSSPDFNNISNFMRDVCAPYARYFNRTEITMKNNKPTKRHGAVFAEAFKAIPVNSLNQMVTLVNYIHNNPCSAKEDQKHMCAAVLRSISIYFTRLRMKGWKRNGPSTLTLPTSENCRIKSLSNL